MNKINRRFFFWTSIILLLSITHTNSAMYSHKDTARNLSECDIQSWSLENVKYFLKHLNDFSVAETIEPIMEHAAKKIVSSERELTSFINFPTIYERLFSLNKQNDPYYARRNICIQSILTEKLLKTLNLEQKQINRYSNKHTIIHHSREPWEIDEPFSLAEALLLHATHNQKVNFRNATQQSSCDKRYLTRTFISLQEKIHANFALEFKVAAACTVYLGPKITQIIGFNYAKKLKPIDKKS